MQLSKPICAGVLGTQLTADRAIATTGATPDEQTVIVDPAGLPYIQSCGPSSAGGAAGAVYAHLGIAAELAFPPDVVAAVTAAGLAKYHRYNASGGRWHHVIHAVGPDLRERPHTWDEALEILGEAYRNVLAELALASVPAAECDSGETPPTILRLLPISGGIFAGPYWERIAPLTIEALARGFSKLRADERRAVELNFSVELCIFMESELEAFREAHASLGS